jgi:hypothetical protein
LLLSFELLARSKSTASPVVNCGLKIVIGRRSYHRRKPGGTRIRHEPGRSSWFSNADATSKRQKAWDRRRCAHSSYSVFWILQCSHFWFSSGLRNRISNAKLDRTKLSHHQCMALRNAEPASARRYNFRLAAKSTPDRRFDFFVARFFSGVEAASISMVRGDLGGV